jgi:hypothetical protein
VTPITSPVTKISVPNEKDTVETCSLIWAVIALPVSFCDLQCDIHLLGGENISAQQPHGRIRCFDLLLLFTAFLWG